MRKQEAKYDELVRRTKKAMDYQKALTMLKEEGHVYVVKGTLTEKELLKNKNLIKDDIGVEYVKVVFRIGKEETLMNLNFQLLGSDFCDYTKMCYNVDQEKTYMIQENKKPKHDLVQPNYIPSEFVLGIEETRYWLNDGIKLKLETQNKKEGFIWYVGYYPVEVTCFSYPETLSDNET